MGVGPSSTSTVTDEQAALDEANPYRSSDHDPVIVGLFGQEKLYLPIIFKW